MRWPAAAALCALVLLVFAAPAGAQLRFGANLNRPANVGYGCEAFPTTDFAGNRFFLASGFGTCTYMGVGSAVSFAESPQAPAEGVVTRVLVRAGPAVGPMRAVILRATRSTGVGAACCFFAAQSQVFTPAPNAVTAVPVRLPMRKDFDVNFGETIDYLGISVLAPGVPIPGHDEGVPGDITRGASTAWFPHVQPGDTRADGGGVGAFTPLIAGDLFPVCNPAPIRGFPTVAQGRVPCIPGVQIVDNLAIADGAGVFVNVICNVAAPCNGDIRFQSRRVRVAAAGSGATSQSPRGSGGASPRLVTYGRVRYKVASGDRKRVRGKLTKAGRSLLRGRRRAKVHAVARVGGRVISSRRVTLRR